MIKEKINQMSLKKILIMIAALVFSFSIVHEVIVLIFFKSAYSSVESSINHTQKRMNKIRDNLDKRDEKIDKDFDDTFTAMEKIQNDARDDMYMNNEMG